MVVPRAIKRLFPQVETVQESKKQVRVTVLDKDCANGKKLQPDECALAVATKRQYHADGAVIGLTASYIIKGTKAVKFTTSEAVAREIVSFDRHHDFAPGDYCLSPVRPSQRRGARQAKSDSPRSGKVRRIIHKRTVRVRDLTE